MESLDVTDRRLFRLFRLRRRIRHRDIDRLCLPPPGVSILNLARIKAEIIEKFQRDRCSAGLFGRVVELQARIVGARVVLERILEVAHYLGIAHVHAAAPDNAIALGRILHVVDYSCRQPLKRSLLSHGQGHTFRRQLLRCILVAADASVHLEGPFNLAEPYAAQCYFHVGRRQGRYRKQREDHAENQQTRQKSLFHVLSSI